VVLGDGDGYGFGILRELESRLGQDGQILREATLYPLLHRLEAKELVEAYWRPGQRGTDRKYYRITKDGRAYLKQRIADGVAAVEGEKFRIYWEGMPIWGKLKPLSMQFMELQTAVVASTYCNSWIYDQLDGDKPFESMARAYSELFICRSDDRKEAYMETMIEKFKIDGVLYHDAKTCPNNSNSRYDMPSRLQARTGKPYVVINGDLNDLRLYSEEQTRTNIEAFVEQLAEG